MKIVPADESTYKVRDDGCIELAGEYTRQVTVFCACGRSFQLRAISDEPLPDRLCDADVTEYLRGVGWRTDSAGEDVCPNCVEQAELL